jgi:hypothetical protein
MEADLWHHGGLQTASSAAGCASQTLEGLISEVEEHLAFFEERFAKAKNVQELARILSEKQELASCLQDLREKQWLALPRVVAESMPLDVEPVCLDMTEPLLDEARGVFCPALVEPGCRTGTAASVEGQKPQGRSACEGLGSPPFVDMAANDLDVAEIDYCPVLGGYADAVEGAVAMMGCLAAGPRDSWLEDMASLQCIREAAQAVQSDLAFGEDTTESSRPKVCGWPCWSTLAAWALSGAW